jgi:hypothetical protein
MEKMPNMCLHKNMHTYLKYCAMETFVEKVQYFWGGVKSPWNSFNGFLLSI